MRELNTKEKQVLRDLWTTGLIRYRRGTATCRILGMDPVEHKRILAGLVAKGVVSTERDRDHTGPYETWEIPAGYKTALGKLVFDED